MRLLMLLLVAVLLTSGCIVINDSPAPGCIKYFPEQFRPIGGCFGKSVIMNLSVSPATACLAVDTNNCNGGVLDISNGCPNDLTIDNITVPAGTRYVGVDVEKLADGTYRPVPLEGNVAVYVPEMMEHVTIGGVMGQKPIVVSFIKTGNLC